MTARLHARPRAFKVPRFYALANDDEATISLKEHAPSADDETIPLSQNASRFAQDSTLSPLDLRLAEEEDEPDSRPSGNWHKVVVSKPYRTSLPKIPVPRTPRPLPLEYSIPVTPIPLPLRSQTRRKPPTAFFWVSSILIAVVVIGSILGLIFTLGHGVLAQRSPATHIMSIQVSPTSAALGAIVQLSGNNFTPRGDIGLTRDGNIPIVDTAGRSIISADSSGSFTDTVPVDAAWLAGAHLLRAEDALLHKMAAFTIMVTGHSPSLHPPHLLLSSASIDLGSGDQATNSTKTITLSNAGGGQISWQSAVTQPWLLLSPESGTFSAGQKITVTIAADRSNMQPGGYSAQVIFTSSASKFVLPVKMQTTLLQPGHSPVLQLTPAVLSFSAMDGGRNPAAQVVTVSDPGALPFNWKALASSDAGWLSVTPPSGNVLKGGSQAVILHADSSRLLPGTYYGSVTFTASGTAAVKGSPQSIYVSITVVPQCALQLTPGNLSFTGVYLQPAPAAKVINVGVTQGCSSSLRWSAIATTSAGGHWLNLTSSSGTTPAHPAVSVNMTGLKPGSYSGLIIFSTSSGSQSLPVTLSIGQPTEPIVTTTPASLSFTAILSQPNPGAQSITITNSAGGVLEWQAQAATNFGGAWLELSATSGNLSAHQSTTVQVAAVVVNGMTPNTYTGMVTITGVDGAKHPALGSPQTIPVNFIVQPACTIASTPPTLSFTGVVGQPDPVTQPVTLSANGTCTHTLTWNASTNAAWLATTPGSGSVSLGAPATTNVGVTLAGLTQNVYTGQVTITAVDSSTHLAMGEPQVITVTLNVEPPCTLQPPSISALNFDSEVGSNPNINSQTFSIAIAGTCSGTITITPTVTQSWLTVAPTSAVISSGSATFTVTVNSASLAVGSYSDTVSLAAVDANGVTITGSPQTLNVNLAVQAAPVLNVGPQGGLSFNLNTGTTSQPISIGNTGGEPLNWSVVLDANAPTFVSLSATGGTNLAGGTNTAVNVIVDATGVPGGSTFSTMATVSALDPITGKSVSGSPATVLITITIAPPAMSLNTSVLAFSTNVGVNPPAQTITLTNTGGDGLTWSAGAPSQSWLTLGVTQGSENSGGSTAIPFNVDVTGLGSGTYPPATVVFTPSVGPPQTVTVTLTIN